MKSIATTVRRIAHSSACALLGFSILLITAACGRPDPPAKHLRIFIAADTEGPSGIADWWASDSKSPFYPERRALYMGDINAAIEGCLNGGATEVVVSDDGKGGINSIPEMLNPSARLIYGPGFGSARLPLLHGLDETFDGVILVGFHAREGTPDGVLAHTLTGESQRHRRYWYHGKEAGELVMYAMAAGYRKVPVIMVTGCEATGREAKEVFGEEIVTVGVKRGLNPSRAILLPPAKAREQIRKGAEEAIRRIGRIKPYAVELPIKVRLQFPNKEFADEHEKARLLRNPNWPGRRVDQTTFEATIESPLDPNFIL